MKEFIVGKNEAGKRMDKLLSVYLKEANKSFIYKMLRKKNITLNDKKATGNEKLICNDIIKIYLSDETFEKFSCSQDGLHKNIIVNHSGLDVIYEDDNIMLINKKAGDLSQKAKADDISINEMVISKMVSDNNISFEELKTFKPGICNRLDRNTSGIIVAGKSLTGLQTMAKAFKDRTIGKYYLAIVNGIVKEPMSIKGYLKKDETTNKVSIKNNIDNLTDKENYSNIETAYTPIALGNNITLLYIHLVTGKTHQIRAHLASINHSLIGDYKYGIKEINDEYKTKLNVKWQLLHCYKIIMPSFENELKNLSNKEFTVMPPKIFMEIKWEPGIVEALEALH